MSRPRSFSVVSTLRPCNGWRGAGKYRPIESGSIGAIVPVSCPRGLCYIQRARTIRLLKLERGFNEQTIPRWLLVPRKAEGGPRRLGFQISRRTDQPERESRHRETVRNQKSRNEGL